MVIKYWIIIAVLITIINILEGMKDMCLTVLLTLGLRLKSVYSLHKVHKYYIDVEMIGYS